VADGPGALVSLQGLPDEVEVDTGRRAVSVGGGMLLGTLATTLDARGWALANLASLPHISVAGAVATGTHGSGSRVGSLSRSVLALEVVGPEGDLRRVARGDPAFPGSVVALGALGLVTRLELDVEPTYTVRQQVYTDVGLEQLCDDFDPIMASGYSVSAFLGWRSSLVDQLWVKTRDAVPVAPPGGVPARGPVHPVPGASIEAVTV
jgi:xylitol oxidase